MNDSNNVFNPFVNVMFFIFVVALTVLVTVLSVSEYHCKQLGFTSHENVHTCIKEVVEKGVKVRTFTPFERMEVHVKEETP